MMCRRTLTGHKDDVTGLAALALHLQPNQQYQQRQAAGANPPAARIPGPVARSPAAAWATTLFASSSADGTVRLW